MQRNILVIALLLMTIAIKANNPVLVNHCVHFKGIVIDKTNGEALAGVKVTIEGTNLVSYTNFEGEFEFNSLLPGDYKIICDLITYSEMITTSIKLTYENESKSFLFKITPSQTPEIFVSEEVVGLG